MNEDKKLYLAYKGAEVKYKLIKKQLRKDLIKSITAYLTTFSKTIVKSELKDEVKELILKQKELPIEEYIKRVGLIVEKEVKERQKILSKEMDRLHLQADLDCETVKRKIVC